MLIESVTYAGACGVLCCMEATTEASMCGVEATSVGILYVIMRRLWPVSECDNRKEINNLGVTFMSECDSLCQWMKC